MADTKTETETRQARAWYVMFRGSVGAQGPILFNEPVTADMVVERMEEEFGEKPREVWPDGPSEEVDEYEYEVRSTDYGDRPRQKNPGALKRKLMR